MPLRTQACVFCLAASAAVWLGCADFRFGGRRGPGPADSDPAASAADPSPTGGHRLPDPSAASERPDPKVMAMVNGQPIYMDRLHEVLIEGYGLEMAHQLVATELVRQQFDQAGLELTEADLRQEANRTLEAIYGSEFTPDQRERYLAELLKREKIAPGHWDLMVRRNAMLAQLAQPQVQVTEDDLREEFAEQFGPRAVVRHIQVESLSQAQMILNEARREGADFAELARTYSRNQTALSGGLLPEMGRQTPPNIPAPIRRAALEMENPGDLAGPVQVGTVYHVLKLERRIEPRQADFAQVRDRLEEQLRQRRVRMLAQKMLRDLVASARSGGRIRYIHGALREMNAQSQELRP